MANPKPPQTVRNNARKALEKRKEHGRGGTAVGIARARDLANGSSLPLSTVKRMYSFFARHEVDKQGKGYNAGEDGYPSNGRIAWLLWGGDSAYAWSARIARAEKNK